MNVIKSFFISLFLVLCGCQSIGYHGPTSDHFDGYRFHFPGEPAKPQSNQYDFYIFWKAVSQFPWPKLAKNPLPTQIPKRFPRVSFVNHATVLIETGKSTILTDPIYAYRPSPFPLIGSGRHRLPGIPFEQLPKIDIVLISHNHYDHLDMPTLKRLEHKFHPLFIVPLGNKNLLKANRLTRVVEMDWWQSHTEKYVKITMLPAQHSAQRGILDSNRSLWAAFGISFPGHKYFFAGDTAYNKHFKEIRRRWGEPDLSMLPIGSYEPRSLLKKEHLSPNDAMMAHLDLNSHRSFAIHWLTFQLSDVYPYQVLAAFQQARKKHHIADKEFFTLENGQSI